MPGPVVKLSVFISSIRNRLHGKGVGAVLVRGASGSFAVKVLGAAMAFGLQVLLARLLGVTQYGIYIYALTWVLVLTIICQLGMNTSLLRFVAAYNAMGEWGLLRGILNRSGQYVFLASVLVGLTASFIIWLLHDRIRNDQSVTFWMAFLLLPLLSLASLRSAGLCGLKHVVLAALPDSFFKPLMIALFAGLTYLYSQESLQAVQVMAFNVLGTLTAFIISTVWLFKALPKQVHLCKPVYAEREWLVVSFPLLFMAGMQLLLVQIDIIMIGAILGAEQAGIYAVASRITGLVVFGLSAVNAIAAPMISELYSTARHLALQRVVTLSARGVFAFALVASISLAIFGEYLLGWFGEEFVKAYEPLLILLIGQVINAMSGSVGYLMVMTGHQKQAAIILGVSATINVLMNVILIYILGIIGAAIATAITTALWNLMMLYYVWRRLNINPTVLAGV